MSFELILSADFSIRPSVTQNLGKWKIKNKVYEGNPQILLKFIKLWVWFCMNCEFRSLRMIKYSSVFMVFQIHQGCEQKMAQYGTVYLLTLYCMLLLCLTLFLFQIHWWKCFYFISLLSQRNLTIARSLPSARVVTLGLACWHA